MGVPGTFKTSVVGVVVAPLPVFSEIVWLVAPATGAIAKTYELAFDVFAGEDESVIEILNQYAPVPKLVGVPLRVQAVDAVALTPVMPGGSEPLKAQVMGAVPPANVMDAIAEFKVAVNVAPAAGVAVKDAAATFCIPEIQTSNSTATTCRRVGLPTIEHPPTQKIFLDAQVSTCAYPESIYLVLLSYTFYRV